MLFRDDDIFLTESPRGFGEYYDFVKFKECHEYFKKAKVKHVLAIVASEIWNHPELVEYLKENKEDFEFGIHGWAHERYSEWEEEAIYKSLNRAKNTIEEVFETRCHWFFPPWNKRNDAMYKACERLELKLNDSFVVPHEALDGKEADALCFHAWNDEERGQIKTLLSTPRT